MVKKAVKPFILGLIVIFLGAFVFTFFGIYSLLPFHLDKVFHVTGGLIVAWFFYNLWNGSFRELDKFQRIIIFMAVASLVGFFWEVMEYSTSISPLSRYTLLRQYVFGGDLTDTLGDLMADVLGGALFGLFRTK